MKDIIIVGAGPAGLSAAIYAQRSGKSSLVLEATTYGGQIINTPDIANYPGLAHVSGVEFATNLFNQAKDLGAEVIFQRVIAVEDRGDIKVVKTSKAEYECRAVILATGAKNRPLGLDNEQSLIGKGISYCATCDGMFFRGKDVAVNGGGNTALEDALFLSNYCSSVTLIHRREGFRGSEESLARLREKENVRFVLNATVDHLVEEGGRLSAVAVRDKNTGETRDLPVTGLFVAIGQTPDNTPFANVASLDEQGYVSAGEDCETGTPGVFTAGDCRTKKVRQLTTAASDGAVAALAACEYVDKL